MKKAYFQYYESFEKIVQKFETAEERESFREKIVNYGLYGQEPEEMNELEEFVWDIVKDMIDDQLHRRQVNKENRGAREAKKTTVKENMAAVSEEQSEAEQKLFTDTEEKDTDPKKAKRFVPPTEEEVKAYCEERNNAVNPLKFISHYQSKGWKVGKEPIKDWKAAVRYWEQSGNTSTRYGYGPPEWPEDKLQL